jgi:hypothetical protein
LGKDLNYLVFQSFDYECTWWRLFQKRVVQLDIYYILKFVVLYEKYSLLINKENWNHRNTFVDYLAHVIYFQIIFRGIDWLIGWCLMPTLAVFQLYCGIFSSPCQRQCELLPSLGIHRPLTLTKRFQRRRFLKIGQSETRIVYGGHVC